MESEDDLKEPIVCNKCEETPQLMSDPSADEALFLECECDLIRAGVSDCLNDSNLLEPFSGRWSNVDKDSTLRY